MRKLTQKEVKYIATGNSQRLANEGTLLGMMTGGWLGYELMKGAVSVSYITFFSLFCAYLCAVGGGFLGAAFTYRGDKSPELA